VAKFSKSGFPEKVPEGIKAPFLEISDRYEGSSRAKNQLDSFIRFDRTPTCDGQTVDTGRQAGL